VDVKLKLVRKEGARVRRRGLSRLKRSVGSGKKPREIGGKYEQGVRVSRGRRRGYKSKTSFKRVKSLKGGAPRVKIGNLSKAEVGRKNNGRLGEGGKKRIEEKERS